MIEVIPGILEKEWDAILARIAAVAPFVEWVQVDIADHTIVPNETLTDVSRFKDLLTLFPHLKLEAHLMVADPVKYIRSLADAGFKRLIAHIECQDPRDFLDQTKYESIEACLSIDAPTEFEQIEPFLEEVDGVLVMTAEAGETGRVFQPETVEKIRLIRQNFIDLPIEVEGGINNVTAKITIEAGATRLVSSSYLFNDPDNIASAIERLKTS